MDRQPNIQINERYKQQQSIPSDMKAKLGSGARFKSVMSKAAEGYEKKGMSHEKAEQIGAAIAAKVGRAKYGAKKFSKLSAMGKK